MISCRNIGCINESYLQSLVSTLKLVKKLKYSKLNLIQLYKPKIMYSSSEFAKYEDLFSENNWKLVKHADDILTLGECLKITRNIY